MVEIVPSKYTYVEELQQCDWNQLVVVCERLSINCAADATKEEMANNIKDALVEDPMIVVKMLPRETIELLFELWEMKDPPLLMDPYRMQLHQLQFLGFLKITKDFNIAINLEAEDIFFFYLKSHKLSKAMERYSIWEQVIFGMLFYYGILDIDYMHEVFTMITKEEIKKEEFLEFITKRVVFWGNTTLLRNESTGQFYLASKEVMNRNQVFQDWDENQDIGFRIYDKEEYISMARGNGVSIWDGIQDLFQFILAEVNDDKYECMIMVKTLIVMIQNGNSYLDIVMKSDTMFSKKKEKEEEFYDILKRLFYATPLYGMKGYSREELAKERKEPFHIIKGGKSK